MGKVNTFGGTIYFAVDGAIFVKLTKIFLPLSFQDKEERELSRKP